MKFIDLSGYAFTGKQAVIDLMREMKGFHVEHFAFEFPMLRIQGGILDLESALSLDWSPIRSDAAIRRFKRLVRRLGSKNDLRRPDSWFAAIGTNYEEHYKGRFFSLSDQYIAQLVTSSWKADWPYALAEVNDVELFVRKLLTKVRVSSALDFEVHLAAPTDFVGVTRKYLQALLTSNVVAGTRAVVMHNAFEPFNPSRSLKFFDWARTIVIDRDPRDNYVQQITYRPLAVPVKTFIERYRLWRDVASRFHDDNPAVMRIHFEDIILDYDATRRKIFDHIEEEASAHIMPRRYLDPAASRKNVGLWRRHPDQSAIQQIQEHLADYLHPD